MKKFLRNFHTVTRALIGLSFLALSVFSFAEESPPQIPYKAKYRSAVDERLTVHRIAVLPTTDNLQGIYARQIEKHIIKELNNNQHWELADDTTVGPMLTPSELEEDAARVKEISESLTADAFIASRVTKGPSGVSIQLNLFLTSDHKLLAQSIKKGISRFEIVALKEQVSEMLKEVLGKIPYDALVLSRQGNLVTVNLGKRDGIEKDKVLTVVQIIKEHRHPKFGILINTDKEILGKIRLLKIDDSLSFGKIIVEREQGAIQKYSKISGLDFVTYDKGIDGLSGSQETNSSLMNRPDGKISFGKSALAWLPQKPPTFGQIGAFLGLGMLTAAQNTGTSSLSARDPIYPNVTLDFELWLTTDWTMRFKIRQGIGSSSNPQGSSPSTLSHSISSYDLLAQKTFRIGPSIWGSRVDLIGGLTSYRNQVDAVSGGLTSLEYSGYKLGIDGYIPVTKNLDWGVGANLFFTLFSKLNESPNISGSASNSINKFGLYVQKKLGVNIKAVGALDFELYSSNFSGATAVSASQKHTTLNAGIYYMF